jgi:hypothetical protein
MSARFHCTVETLAWRDRPFADIHLPGGVLELTLGLGSGLSRCAADPPGRLWAIADRGPNLKVDIAVERYGLDHLRPLHDLDGAKILPSPQAGPTLCELQTVGDTVELLRTLPLMAGDRPVSGLPLPGGPEATMEPVFGIDGEPLGTDPDGADTEALAVLADGSFWVADEYGPSLLKVDGAGEVRMRWTPEGVGLSGARVPVHDILPKIAGARRLNCGFEGLAASADGRELFVAFQSGLAGEPHQAVRFWTLDAETGALLAEHLYPFDRPKAFRRDGEAGKVRAKDLKVCELAWLGPGRLLVLERASRSTKLYRVELDSGSVLEKQLVLDTDEHPEIGSDLEGMALLSDRQLVLVNDNDFGVEGAATRFVRVAFDEDL